MQTPAKPTTDRTPEGEEVAKKRTSRYKTPFKSAADKSSKLAKTYLTPGELETFEANYRAAYIKQKMSRSQFIKERILANEDRGWLSDSGEKNPLDLSREAKRISKEEMRLLSTVQLNRLDELTKNLNRIGVNYNQSTRRLNQFELRPEILDESVKNKALEKQIVQLIEKLEYLYWEIEGQFTRGEN